MAHAGTDTPAQQRRSLRFETVGELLAEIDRIEAAARPGGTGIRVSGNWSAGQIMQHLAKTIGASYQGFDLRLALPVRLFGRLARRYFLSRTLPPGVSNPLAAPGGRLAPDAVVWTDDGARMLREHLSRIASGDPMTAASPIFGRLSHQDWVRLHLRHAELHMGFIHITGS